MSASAKVDLEIEVFENLARLHHSEGVDRSLQVRFDKQDGGTPLTLDVDDDERAALHEALHRSETDFRTGPIRPASTVIAELRERRTR